jgi:hypothetical protein
MAFAFYPSSTKPLCHRRWPQGRVRGKCAGERLAVRELPDAVEARPIPEMGHQILFGAYRYRQITYRQRQITYRQRRITYRYRRMTCRYRRMTYRYRRMTYRYRQMTYR